MTSESSPTPRGFGTGDNVQISRAIRLTLAQFEADRIHKVKSISALLEELENDDRGFAGAAKALVLTLSLLWANQLQHDGLEETWVKFSREWLLTQAAKENDDD